MADVILDALPTRQEVRLDTLPGRQVVTLDALPSRQVIRLESLPPARYHTFFTGVGSLTARAAIAMKAALSASGTLTLRSGVSGGAVATSGSGSLASSTRVGVKAAASGSGSLSSVVRLGAGGVSLSGEGSWVNVVRSLAAATLSAVGAASAATRVDPSATQPSGSGSASAATRVNLPMALSGTGTLGGTILGRGVVGATFAADGQARDETSAWASAFFQAEGMPSVSLSGRFYVNASLTGSGSAATVSRVSLAAQTTSAGSLSAAAFPGARVTAAFTGVATLTAATAGGVLANLTGAATATLLGYEVEMAVAVGSASGALVSVTRNPAAAADTGEGTMAVATQVPVSTPQNTGVATLQAVTVIPAPAAFSGAATLTPNAVQAGFTPMKMNKTVAQNNVPLGTWTKVTGWTADTARPQAAVINSDALSPGGGGQTVQITGWATNGYEYGAQQVRLVANGQVVATGNLQTYGGGYSPGNGSRFVSVTYVGPMPAGDVSLEFWTDSSFSGANNVTGASLAVDYPVGFDAASDSMGNGNRVWTHTSTKPGIIVVSMVHLNPNAGTPSPTIGGQSTTLIGRSVASGSQGFVTVHARFMPAGTYTVSIATAENYSIGQAVSVSGVSTLATAEQNRNSNSANPATNALTAYPFEELLSMFFTKRAAAAQSGTVRKASDHPSGFVFARAVEGVGSSPQTQSLTMPASDTWAVVTARLAP